MQRSLFLDFYQFLSAEKYPNWIRIRLGNHFFPNCQHKYLYFEKKSIFFSEKE